MFSEIDAAPEIRGDFKKSLREGSRCDDRPSSDHFLSIDTQFPSSHQFLKNQWEYYVIPGQCLAVPGVCGARLIYLDRPSYS